MFQIFAALSGGKKVDYFKQALLSFLRKPTIYIFNFMKPGAAGSAGFANFQLCPTNSNQKLYMHKTSHRL